MKQTLYVHRPLLNADEVIAWAKQQGFASTLDPDDMHVTVTFSKIPFDWSGLKEHKNKIHVKGGHRDVDHLGEKGAIVLHFDSPELHRRWQAIIDAGASWDYEGYHPHISITYDGGDLDPTDMEPYVGDLMFGPEIFAPLQEDWNEKITEIPLNDKKNGVLENKSFEVFKYSESINGEQTMNNSLASLLMKNIDLILEAYNIDEQGNLIEVNKRKVVESDDIFHRYFVQRMNETFRQINEADPIMDPGMNMHPQHSMHGMHPMGMGMGANGEQDDGLGGDDERMGDMAMDDMHGGHGMQMPDANGMGGGMEMGGGMGGMGGMGGGMAAGAPRGNMPMESAEGDDFDWVFNEETDLDVNSLFDLNEWEDEEEKAEHEDEHGKLDEFSGGGFLPDGDMDHEGGHTGFGGDMGGMSGGGGQDMDMPSGMDMMGGGGDEMGGDEDMVTVHGTTDQGGEFEFSFDPETLGFEGGGMGGHEDFLPGGGDDGEEHHHHEEHEPHHSEHGEHEEPGMGEEEMGEAAQHWHNGKPAKGNRGKKSSRMAVVPANPATKHTAPFPSPMGNRQKK